jgi:hypothetical protein
MYQQGATEFGFPDEHVLSGRFCLASLLYPAHSAARRGPTSHPNLFGSYILLVVLSDLQTLLYS